MKVIFVLPAVGRKEGEPYIASWKMEPLTLAVLASLTPHDIEVKLIDDRLEPINFDEKADAVAITVETYTAKRAYGIAAQFRKRGVPVIFGGYHPTLLPDEASMYADAIIIGEAEHIWQAVLRDLKNGALRKIYLSDSRPELKGVGADRSIFKGKKYLPITLVETSRGCKFACNFCSISAYYKRTHNFRPAEEVAAEIEKTGKNNFFLVDDNIVANPDAARKLFKALIPLRIRWVSQCTINVAQDEDLLKLMVKSGCMGVLIGFESLNRENLADMNKGWINAHVNYKAALKTIRDHGLGVYATFVFGYDHDSKETFERTVEFAIEEKFFLAAFNHLVPFPGTELYQKLSREKRLLYDKWWLNPDYQYGDIAFRPKMMLPAQLTEYCLQARRNFFRFSSIFSRANLQANCRNLIYSLIYFSTNLMLQKEVAGKRGIKLGEGLGT